MFIFAIIFYLINCIIFPLLLLPFQIVLRFFGVSTSFWNIIVYYVSFGLLNVKYNVQGNFIKSGFILANHRSFLDFAYDPYISESAIVGRTLAFISVVLFSVVGILDNRCIIINRSNTRNITFNKVVEYINSKVQYSKKILFWPEGTRRSYTTLTLEETKHIIKPGLLKSIYEYKKYPVQIMMSNKKEKIFNEKTFSCSFGETIQTILSEPIYPEDYKSFQEFLDKIHTDWYELFHKVY